MSDPSDRYYDPVLSPEPPEGPYIGASPWPLNDIADVQPKAPTEHVGASPYPLGWTDDVSPEPTDHKNYQMQMHRGVPKPGSFHDSPNDPFDKTTLPDKP